MIWIKLKAAPLMPRKIIPLLAAQFFSIPEYLMTTQVKNINARYKKDTTRRMDADIVDVKPSTISGTRPHIKSITANGINNLSSGIIARNRYKIDATRIKAELSARYCSVSVPVLNRASGYIYVNVRFFTVYAKNM